MTIHPRVLITAGPTHEPIDEVRYIGNRSSGRMGLTLASASAARGWPTTLLLGPIAGPLPRNFADNSQIKLARFRTAAELQQLLMEHWPAHDVLLMAAAVADYTVASIALREPMQSRDHWSRVEARNRKIKRSTEPLMLELAPTPDLLLGLKPITQPHQFIIAFALEPLDTMFDSARAKLAAKGVDAIVANPIETLDAPEVSATLMMRDGRALTAPAAMPKADFAAWLLDQLQPVLAHCVNQVTASSQPH